jgi:hypothetical protein
LAATAFLHVFYVLRLACRWLNINYSEIRAAYNPSLEYVESLVQAVVLKKFVKSILVLSKEATSMPPEFSPFTNNFKASDVGTNG